MNGIGKMNANEKWPSLENGNHASQKMQSHLGLSENVVYLNGSPFNGENNDQPMDLEVPYFQTNPSCHSAIVPNNGHVRLAEVHRSDCKPFKESFTPLTTKTASNTINSPKWHMSFSLCPPVSICHTQRLPRALVATAWWARWSHHSDELHPENWTDVRSSSLGIGNRISAF